MSKIFYMEMFRAMASHIVESYDCQLWIMENNVSWERDCYLDMGSAKENGERLQDWEMAAKYLKAVGDLGLDGFTKKRKGTA